MPTTIGGWLAHAIHEESRCTQNFHVDWFENDGAVLEHRTTISICTLSVTLCCTCAFHTISGLNSGTPIQIHDREKSIIFHTRRGSTPHNAALLRHTATIKYRLHQNCIQLPSTSFYSCKQQLLLRSPPANNSGDNQSFHLSNCDLKPFQHKFKNTNLLSSCLKPNKSHQGILRIVIDQVSLLSSKSMLAEDWES